jgi:hypothetical protein
MFLHCMMTLLLITNANAYSSPTRAQKQRHTKSRTLTSVSLISRSMASAFCNALVTSDPLSSALRTCFCLYLRFVTGCVHGRQGIWREASWNERAYFCRRRSRSQFFARLSHSARTLRRRNICVSCRSETMDDEAIKREKVAPVALLDDNIPIKVTTYLVILFA